MEKIQEAVKKAFEEHNLDVEKFCHDITCFNKRGTRCVCISDNGDSMDKQFVIVGLEPNLDASGDWFESYFSHSGYGKEQQYKDGIDAMCDADAFIQDHD